MNRHKAIAELIENRPNRWASGLSPPTSGPRVEIIRPDGCRLYVQNVDLQMALEITAMFLGMRQ